jgi:hypothetical protein
MHRKSARSHGPRPNRGKQTATECEHQRRMPPRHPLKTPCRPRLRWLHWQNIKPTACKIKIRGAQHIHTYIRRVSNDTARIQNTTYNTNYNTTVALQSVPSSLCVRSMYMYNVVYYCIQRISFEAQADVKGRRQPRGGKDARSARRDQPYLLRENCAI